MVFLMAYVFGLDSLMGNPSPNQRLRVIFVISGCLMVWYTVCLTLTPTLFQNGALAWMAPTK